MYKEPRKRNKSSSRRWKSPCRACAEKLTDLLKPDERGGGMHRFNEQILLLYGGRREALKEYYIEKYTKILQSILLLILLLIAAVIASLHEDRSVEGGKMLRPLYREGNRQEALAIEAEGESEERTMEIILSERRYSDQKAKALLNQAEKILDAGLLGENASAEAVREDLWMPETLLDGAVSVSYITIPYGMIDETGKIVGEPKESGSLIEIRADLTCQDQTLCHIAAVRVLPPLLTGEEAFWEEVRQAAEEADSEQAESAYLTLPDAVQGRHLTWLYPKKPYLKAVLFLCLTIPLLIYYVSDERMKEKAKEREAQLTMDYGDLMWKMTMLTGAGLTIRAAFFKIAEEYLRAQEKKKGSPPRYVYEEVAATCREMKSGVAEGDAYEHFGKRCAVSSYKRLSTLLTQNLKKGSKGLTELLEKEAEASMQERRAAARQMGEKAGTKLLMPMILMLGVVILILVVPAFSSF